MWLEVNCWPSVSSPISHFAIITAHGGMQLCDNILGLDGIYLLQAGQVSLRFQALVLPEYYYFEFSLEGLQQLLSVIVVSAKTFAKHTLKYQRNVGYTLNKS